MIDNYDWSESSTAVPTPLNPKLLEQLRSAVKAAKDKPYTKAWEKAQSYVLAQAEKGFKSCTLPLIKDRDTARHVMTKFIQEGIQCNAHVTVEGSLLKCMW